MSRVTVILLALGVDLLFGDPPNRFHPVVLMGNWLTLGRKSAPAQHRFWFGAGWILAGIALFTQLVKKLSSLSSIFPPSFSLLLSAMLFKFVLAYRNLRRAVQEIRDALTGDNLPEARRLLAWHLVSRDTSQLTEAEVVGAALESLAENVTDSLATPLLAFVAGGLPAAYKLSRLTTSTSRCSMARPVSANR